MLASPHLALLAALLAASQIDAFKFTSPDSKVDLSAENIKISWEDVSAKYNALDLEWYIKVTDEDGWSAIQFPIATKLRLPKTTEYDWNPEYAQESLERLREHGTDPELYIEYTLSSWNPFVKKRTSQVKFTLEGVDSSESTVAADVVEGL